MYTWVSPPLLLSRRAGAQRVSSLEMVPAMAAVARHCVRANGMDGKVVLVDRGSTIDGEMAKGPERGKKRAQVLWGRIVTPLNIAIQVNSPGTDTLGAAGLDGSIDVLSVNPDRDAHDHVLRPLRDLAVAAHEVGSL